MSVEAARRGLLAKAPLFLGAVRFQETIFALPFAFSGMVLAADGLPEARDFVWITVAMVGARTLGMSANRVIDRHIDAGNPRTAMRHLPQGLLGARDMYALCAASALVFFVAAWQLNALALALAPVAAAYLIAYPYAKRVTWAGSFMLGSALAIAPVGAWIGVTGSIEWEAGLLAAAVASWASGFDILYHTEDRDYYVAQRAALGVAALRDSSRVQDVRGAGRDCSRVPGCFWAGDGTGVSVLRRVRRRVRPARLQAAHGFARRPVAHGSGVHEDQRLRLDHRARGGHSLAGCSMSKKRPVVVGISGASGSMMAEATIDRLLGLGWPVIATISPAARMVWREEMEESLGETIERWTDTGLFTTHAIGDLSASIASGTFPSQGMAIVPCSMGTAAAVAAGLSDNLMRRAADVALKERRRLVIVPRETPVTAVHLENLATLARLGAVVLPPQPAFYLKPQGIADVVEFVAERVLMALGVSEALPEHLQYSSPERGG